MTIVLVVDERGRDQLRHTIPTWQKFRPEMWEMSWLIIYDSLKLRLFDIEELADKYMIDAAYASWNPNVAYESQREKMLTAFITHVHKFVGTDWFMKIDTDAYATKHTEWIGPDLFVEKDGKRPAWIASSWAYTKAKGGGGSIVDWARKLEEFGDRLTDKPRLNLEQHVDGKRINLRRMASWISIYDAAWARWLAKRCEAYCGQDRIPVPSQDTVAWYVAARCGHHTVAKPKWAKRLGWGNQSNTDRLRETCREILLNA